VERVVVPFSMHISSSVEEQSDNFVVTMRSGPMKRVGIISCLPCVRICAMREQSDNLGATSFRCLVQPCPALETSVGLVEVNKRWVCSASLPSRNYD
jgi:hypothetical protein